MMTGTLNVSTTEKLQKQANLSDHIATIVQPGYKLKQKELWIPVQRGDNLVCTCNVANTY